MRAEGGGISEWIPFADTVPTVQIELSVPYVSTTLFLLVAVFFIDFYV